MNTIVSQMTEPSIGHEGGNTTISRVWVRPVPQIAGAISDGEICTSRTATVGPNRTATNTGARFACWIGNVCHEFDDPFDASRMWVNASPVRDVMAFVDAQ